MILDAPSFKLVLTPEAALGLVQKELQKRGWKKVEVEEIRLVYTPYWIFSFDVLAEGSQPSGRAALNANSGELDEVIPIILEHPLDKTKKTDEKSEGEVEGTAISRSEVERVAPAKIAAQVGLKKESISVSAISKYYIPTYRIWAVVPPKGGETYKLQVDALMGIPTGLDAIPGKGKGWQEETEFTLEKLKTPGGWAEMIGATFTALVGGKLSRTGLLILLGLVAVSLAFIVFARTPISSECAVSQEMIGEKQFFNSLGEQYLNPLVNRAGQFYVNGECFFKNTGKEAQTVCLKVTLKIDGSESQFFNSTCIGNLQPSETPTEKEFTITWTYPAPAKYSIKVERFV